MRPLDTLFMSTGAILSNKLRSILTLVGVVAGVASIIAVMTAISIIQGTLEREMSVLGAQVFQVQKWPAGGFRSAAERRKAMRRPPLTLANAQAIRDHVASVDLVGSEIWDFGFKAQYKGVTTNPNLSICGGTPDEAPPPASSPMPPPPQHRSPAPARLPTAAAQALSPAVAGAPAPLFTCGNGNPGDHRLSATRDPR